MNASFAGAVRFAQDLIRIPSPPGGEGVVAERVAEEFRALGFSDVRIDDVGNAIGVVPGTSGGPAVMLSCHLDVVAEGDVNEWEHPPYAGVVSGDVLHGRGAMDIKGPLALQTHAAAALAGRTEGDIIVAHTVLEERGGLGMKHLLESGAVAPDVVVIGESTNGDIAIGHRGRAEIEVLIRGRAGHASAPDRAANALDLLPFVLAAIQDVNDREPSDPLLGPATAVATDVTVRPESRNVIPDEARVIIDWRILPGSTTASLVSRVEAALARRLPDGPPEGFEVTVHGVTETQTTYTGVSREKELLTPGFTMAPDHPLVRAAAAAVGRRDDPAASATVRPWTFATDGGWTCGVFGVPSLGFAPGEERFAHTNRERLDLHEAEWAFNRYASLIPALQDALTSHAP